jgi:hypothetical protein
MLLKIGKMTPWCPKRLPGGEYTGESQLPGGEYTAESRLPGDEYTGESRLPCDEYTGESTSLCALDKHKNMFTKKLSGE